MCARFDEWKNEIQAYCEKSGLDFKKAAKLFQSSNADTLLLQYYDPDKGKLGLLDETPMPAVLWIFREPTGLRFEQTEYTRKYLS